MKDVNNATDPTSLGKCRLLSEAKIGYDCKQDDEVDNEVAPDANCPSPAFAVPRSNHVQPDMYIPHCMIDEDPHLLGLLREASSDPPYTTSTLKELDLHSIQHNLNLRVDINYDHDLFFQPISGRKGDMKRMTAEKYWLSLVAESRIYLHGAHCGYGRCQEKERFKRQKFQSRLPTLFEHLKDIVQMLTPDIEHEDIASHLDKDFLVQQIENGVLGIPRLADWLVMLLTSHCAPMRDEEARECARLIRCGFETSNMEIMVKGIENLFAFLEAMKLDVANHQIRVFRLQLIEDTIAFERHCFTKALDEGSFHVEHSRRWYREERKRHVDHCQGHLPSSLSVDFVGFLHGIAGLCRTSTVKLPTTFQYDRNRIIRLQEDLQDLIQIHLCMLIFDRRFRDIHGYQFVQHKACKSIRTELQSRIIILTEDDDGNGGAISEHLDAIAVEITRTICQLQDQNTIALAESTALELDRTVGALRAQFEREETYETVTNAFVSILEQRTVTYAEEFFPLKTLEMSNRQNQWLQTRSSAAKESALADWEDMARRLAHLSVLNWRVWADLCYIDRDSPEDFVENDEQTSSHEPFTPESPSVTMKSRSTAFSPADAQISRSEHHDPEYGQHKDENTLFTPAATQRTQQSKEIPLEPVKYGLEKELEPRTEDRRA